MPALSHCAYHSKQVGGGLLGGNEGGGLCLACKFTSRLRYPSGALADSQNQFCEGALASTFICFCFHLSQLFSHAGSCLYSSSASFCFLPIILRLLTFFHTFSPSTFYLAVCFVILPFPYPLCFSHFFLLSVCHQAVMIQASLFFFLWWVVKLRLDGNDTNRCTQPCMLIKSFLHVKNAHVHRYIQT